MAVRTNKLTKEGVPRKVRTDKLMPDSLVACHDCKLELPHALLSKAHLCQRCSWLRMINVFIWTWHWKLGEYEKWQAVQAAILTERGNNDTKS